MRSDLIAAMFWAIIPQWKRQQFELLECANDKVNRRRHPPYRPVNKRTLSVGRIQAPKRINGKFGFEPPRECFEKPTSQQSNKMILWPSLVKSFKNTLSDTMICSPNCTIYQIGAPNRFPRSYY
jgi:hypothetical protein